MKKPKMILFDYGQTLFDERDFNIIKGTKAILNGCVENKGNVTAKEVELLVEELNKEIEGCSLDENSIRKLEIHNHQFQSHIYEYFGMQRIVSPLQIEKIFWSVSCPGILTKNIKKFLKFLDEQCIRSGVISNISFSGQALESRINEYLPGNSFEFIMATSEYIFRKPHYRIFELALKKANLSPDEVWYCGDNAVNDVDGASEVGIKSIWYKGACLENFIKPKKNTIEINDWKELKSLIDMI